MLDVVVFVLIFVVTYWLIIDHRVNKHFAAFLGAVTCGIAGWGLNTFSESELVVHLESDMLVLAIIVGNLIVVDVGSKSGLFHFISIKILKKSKGDPKLLLLYMGLLSVVLTVLVNNIGSILICSSLTILACKRLDYDPKPYIIAQMVLVNVAGLTTLVSSVPNMIIGTLLGDGFGFLEYLEVGLIIAGLLVTVSFVFFIVYFELPEPHMDAEQRRRAVEDFDEWAAVTNKKLFYSTAIILITMFVLFVFSTYLGLGIPTICISGAAVMLIVSGSDFDRTIQSVDWPLLSFFMGLFIVVASLDFAGVIDLLADGVELMVGNNGLVAVLVVLWVSAVLSGIVDSIVVAAALTPVVQSVADSTGVTIVTMGWALIIGATLGGGLTPIGSPCSIIGIGVLSRRAGIQVGWSEWIGPAWMAFVHLIVATVFLTAMFYVVG